MGCRVRESVPKLIQFGEGRKATTLAALLVRRYEICNLLAKDTLL